jgi:hypothetical protein
MESGLIIASCNLKVTVIIIIAATIGQLHPVLVFIIIRIVLEDPDQN